MFYASYNTVHTIRYRPVLRDSHIQHYQESSSSHYYNWELLYLVCMQMTEWHISFEPLVKKAHVVKSSGCGWLCRWHKNYGFQLDTDVCLCFQASYKEVLKNFLETTTSHGLPRIASERSTCRKIFWVLFFLGALSYFVYSLAGLVKMYREYPVSVHTKIKARCSDDQFMKSSYSVCVCVSCPV